MIAVTYSSGTMLCQCERKYYFRNELCLVPRHEDEEALWVGSAMHVGREVLAKAGQEAALAAIDAWVNDNPVIGDGAYYRQLEQAAKARAMVRASVHRWPVVPSADAVVEHQFDLPVISPDGKRVAGFRFQGKFDGLDHGIIYDWKSAQDPRSMLNQKVVGYQAELYAIAAMALGLRVTGVQFRLIARPSLQFQKQGVPTKKYDGDAVAYEQACYEWLINGDDKMLETPEPMLDLGRVNAAKQWLVSICKRIKYLRRTNEWMTNENACHDWQRNCEYLPICKAAAGGCSAQDVIDSQYVKAPPHRELLTHPEKDLPRVQVPF